MKYSVLLTFLLVLFCLSANAKNFIPWQEPIIAVHAGGDLHVPANTMTAIKKSAALGCRYFEIDIRSTKDDVIILMHDETLERTTNMYGPVKAYKWQDMCNADKGSYVNCKYKDAKIPTLEEVLLYAKKNDLYLLLDICDSTAAGKKLYSLLKKHDMLHNVKAFMRAGPSKYKLTLDPKIPRFNGSLLALYRIRTGTAGQIIEKYETARKKNPAVSGVLLLSYEVMTDGLNND